MGIVIRPVASPEECRQIMDVMKSAWNMPDYTEAVPHHFIWAIAQNGGIVLVAYDEEERRIVGFVLGILAMKDGKLYHYSHMAGVVEERKYRGIGFRLKLAQREEALKQGLDLIVWTYDPLQGLNARFNVGKLGVICRTFYRNYYGELRDSINRGMPTDRFKAEWWIRSPRVERRIKGELPSPSLREAEEVAAFVTETKEVKSGIRELVRYDLDLKDDVLLVEIPENISAVRDYDFDMALRWRLAAREIFETYFARGYVVVDFISERMPDGHRRNFYVLWRADLDRILRGELPCGSARSS